MAGSGIKTFNAKVNISSNLSISRGVIVDLGNYTSNAFTLTIDGVVQPSGSWGSSASSSTFKNDTYFTPSLTKNLNVDAPTGPSRMGPSNPCTINISGGTSPICYNTDPGTMTATASGGNNPYSYQWYSTTGKIDGATNSTYDPGNITVTTGYYCTVFSGSCDIVTSNTIVITVDANLTAGINGGNSPICYNTDPGTMTATGGGGTGSYTYLWYKNGNNHLG